MYDQLWEDHPKIKKIRAESETKSEIKALQGALTTIVQAIGKH